jgi:hypothetical protein
MSTETMKMALEALEYAWGFDCDGAEAVKKSHLAIVALRAAIEQAEQAQPVWDASAPLVVHPHPAFQNITPPRQPLTDEEIEDLYFDRFSMGELKAFARAIEVAHGIKE